MPYIKKEQREELEPELGALIQKMMSMPEFHSNGRAGILNYVITDILDSCFGPLSMQSIKTIMKQLECWNVVSWSSIEKLLLLMKI